MEEQLLHQSIFSSNQKLPLKDRSNENSRKELPKVSLINMLNKNLNERGDKRNAVSDLGYKNFPSFDDRQVAQLKSSFVNNYRQYNANDRPQNHVMILQNK